jgi:hypothetical protein
MKGFFTALVLACSITASAQTTEDHIRAAQAELALALKPVDASFYHGLTDHSVKVKPAPMVLGAAGFAFKDPTFGSRMWRVTDATTSVGLSQRMPSSAHATPWNADGTILYTVNDGGGVTFHSFDGTNVTKLTVAIDSQLEPQFSLVDPKIIYAVRGHKVRKWRVDVVSWAEVFDFDVKYPQLPLVNTYIGGFLLADGDVLAAHFGGGGIDQHVFVHHSVAGLLDVRGLGWKIHAISIDRTGRYVLVYPANDPNTGRLPVGVAQVQIWDTVARTLKPMTVRPAGHGVMGYESFINQDCCTSTTWDASQWEIRDLAAPDVTKDLIPSPLTPQHIYLAEHTNWRAAQATVKVPVVSASYRYGAGLIEADYPLRAWVEEVIAIATDGSGTVWRFAHTQAVNPAEFWNQPIIHCAPSGHFCAFTSNWGNPTGRQDVFLVELK